MIDIENLVIDRIAKRLKRDFPAARVSSDEIASPPQFPAVVVVMLDNPVNPRTQTSSCMENHVDPLFQIDVYSNKKSGRKLEAKKLIACVDAVFSESGFTRIYQQPVPAMDTALYRIVARYTATVSNTGTVHRKG